MKISDAVKVTVLWVVGLVKGRIGFVGWRQQNKHGISILD